MAQLVCEQGILAGQFFKLEGETLLGRAEECTISLDDLAASRRHAMITPTPEGCRIEDLGSGNGTYVNGERISGPCLLKDQDVVQISEQVFRFFSEQNVTAQGAITVEEQESATETIHGKLDVGATMIGGVFTPSPSKDAAKANERLQTIVRISNAVQTELDLNKLLELILEQLFDVFDQADRSFLMLYDDAGELQPAASRDRKGKTEQITISRKIVNEVTGQRVALLSMDAMGDQRFDGAMSIAAFNIRSMMCAPLIAQEDLLGIIHVDTATAGRKFTEDDLELLTGVAAQTALAIASAKMHEKLLTQDRMERDLKIASQVQTSFLPSKTPEVEGMEFAAFYQAALDIGGDLYDFIPQPEDNMAIVVGDVSGKGIPAALMMARMSSDVRFYAARHRDPSQVLPLLNERQAESGITETFVTMAFCSVNCRTHEVLIGNAAHCLPLVRRAAENDVIEVSGEPGFPLGVVEGFEYEQATYALQPGDVVLLVSDGVTEAMNAEHEQYGEERLKQTVATAPASAAKVMEAVLGDIKEHVGETKQSDDLTCVSFGVCAGDSGEEDAEEELGLMDPDDLETKA